MAYFVGFIGFLIVVAALAFLASPGRLKVAFATFLKPGIIYIVALLRIIIGVLFMLAAGHTRHPTFVLIVGLVIIVTGVITTLIGGPRLVRFAGWWTKQPDNVLRLWAVLAGVFGAAILWAAF